MNEPRHFMDRTGRQRIERPIQEVDLLFTFVLRADGYRWCDVHGLDRGALMNDYWQPLTHADLMQRTPDFQMAVMFLQQRSLRNMGDVPSGDILRLWRRLFVQLAGIEPSMHFRGDSWETWQERYSRLVPQLKIAIEDRLANGTTLDEPFGVVE